MNGTEPRAGAGSALAELRVLIEAGGGRISFERFMHEALYHPEWGYYSRRVPTIGRLGDFSTGPSMHPALGRALAAWAVDRRARLLRSSPWHVIELGAGGGQMADDFLTALGWWGRRGLRYNIVETSVPLRGEQQARLARWTQVSWHAEIQSALEAADGRALILSNEFVDAFPCVRLESAGDGEWYELEVAWEGEGLVSRRASCALERTSAEEGLTAGCAPSAAAGQRVEWHRAYHRWLQSWVDRWRCGALLTIDYGDEMPGLYHRRPSGSMRAYFRHMCLGESEIYQRVGHQDLTADVNFTDLRRWGHALGLQSSPRVTQADFLQTWLPTARRKQDAVDPAQSFLQDADGAGGAFKVLEQQRRALSARAAQNAA